MKEIDCEILVIGSGLVGLVAAHSLSSLNFRVVLVDKKNFSDPKLSFKDNRTVAVSEGSKQFLERLGLWNHLKHYAEPIKKIKVFDRSPSSKIEFQNSISNQNLGYVIENKKFIIIRLGSEFMNQEVQLMIGPQVIMSATTDKKGDVKLSRNKITTKRLEQFLDSADTPLTVKSI